MSGRDCPAEGNATGAEGVAQHPVAPPPAPGAVIMGGMSDDPFLWLEEIDSERALDWVRPRAEAALAELGASREARAMRWRALEILDATDRVAWCVRRGGWAYDVWRDADHPRGLWRRIPWSELVAGGVTGDDPRWEVLLDVDALRAEEGVDWVYAGTVVRRPADDRALVRLSRGGSDAAELREFDLVAGRLVPESEGGFRLPECKWEASWVDADTLLLGAPLDAPGDGLPGESRPGADATDSGYARLVRLWRRGSNPADAPVVDAGERGDVAVSAGRDARSGRIVTTRAVDFHDALASARPTGVDPVEVPARPLPVPSDCRVLTRGDWMVLLPRTTLESGGRQYPGGSVLAVPWARLESGTGPADGGFASALPEPDVLFAPTPSTTIADVTWGRDRLLLTILHDTESRLEALRVPEASGAAGREWSRLPVRGLPEHVTVDVLSCDDLADDDPDAALLAVSGPVVPPSLVLLDGGGDTRTLASTPARFDATGVEVSRHVAVSDDGTRVPYTVMRGPAPEGPAPTILYGYGGFEIPMRPSYAALRGALWLERGGTYVVAGIRGGGEYGPEWHAAALREKRPRAYEDFAAVARELVASGVTTVDRLGATGGSNGGLLMGVMLTRYPELFRALAIAVPLLDMRRYHLLLAGASWMAEYGDPDSSDWEDFLGAYSPYQHVRPASEVRYPDVLMTTSTRDDRVHPGHARKTTAALEAAGQPVTYYENVEGGHSGSADNAQAARQAMLTYEFFRLRLGLGGA